MKNWDQFDGDVTMTLHFSDKYKKLLKIAYFKIAATSSSFDQPYWDLGERLNTHIAFDLES